MSNALFTAHALGVALRSIRPATWIQAVVWIVVVAFLAYGFEFRTPTAVFTELRAQDAALVLADSLAVERDATQTRLLEALTIGECIDRDERELQLMGLGPTCERLLSNDASQNAHR